MTGKSSKTRLPEDQPTRFPPPTTDATMFDRSLSLPQVVAICERDPGCGFRRGSDAADTFYFLDDHWFREPAHRRMPAHSSLGWLVTLGFYDATVADWYLVDLSKIAAKAKQRIESRYVGQTPETRRYLSDVALQELREHYG